MENELKQVVEQLKVSYHAAGMNDLDIVITMLLVLTQGLYDGDFAYGAVNNGTGDVNIEQTVNII